jgi:3-methyl-2-oxobutanoate hydroxymethyltransferase
VRGTKRAMVIADMPFMSYQVSREKALSNAGRFLKEAQAHGVKLEGGREIADLIHDMTSAGIPVMAHLGLTPQSVHQFGGHKIQGREDAAAKKILDDARAIEEAGAFSVVLECIPAPLAKTITESINIPTIGIGAGVDCDGQVLVINDILGMFERFTPKFVKKYCNISAEMRKAVKQYTEEVRNGAFPDKEHSLF